ncbi:acetyl-CoA synthetase (ADP-forming) [Monocercomonoides exilis]|uniref:acetyl-CoA synthetase (ADP-forming) n=1 Tax=Monocercomonoides exilis TaxID=2049356 RepID=UPI00355AAF3E|nr:acetyl-CoA synthetase (ADP-forming) [Monocercomonoides exilis]|eukprot:MONOS_10363.1-p1 / transcript=MONOS_10363.1 / gene=MONOS_10363 / organism=Monocercomonoides_exilis_PA203 / gene_product=acetyl-CoA synthetase (ADP-forming) / transcript_product=acetyl-CoA synthetase (ADP-forming) / location=Mono_scaffold00468:8305-10473(-) / protein_length=723 / sequence_SO=supercontig / SO=protein_coding / is_pseudo=false
MSDLHILFNPKTVALIGASESVGVGRTMMSNLMKCSFGGTIYPINPKRDTILGVKCHKSVKELEKGSVDLAIIAVNARFVPGSVRDCAEIGVKTCIIVSAGFAEMGEPGRALEREIMSIAKPVGMRIVGPNCLGLMSSSSGLNATFAADMVNDGSVAFFSQSGALCTSVLDYSKQVGFGFSAFVSVGSMLDVDWPTLIDYFGNDEKTSAICIYMETVGKAKPFLEACQRVSKKKPIVVIKAGRSAAGKKAASSHTGALAGADEVADAAFERAGVLRVVEIADLFALMEMLNSQPMPKGKRLTVVTNAGGPGVLTTDSLYVGGGELAPVSDEMMDKFNEFLPAAWSHGNPIDILGDALPDRYEKTVRLSVEDPNVDAILVILTPQDMTDPTATAEALKQHAKCGKLFMCSWMGGKEVAKGTQILREAKIPVFNYPDQAVRVFNYLHSYGKQITKLEEPTLATPELGFDLAKAREEVRQIYSNALEKGRTILSEYESKKILAAYHIPGGQTELALSPDEAVEAAKKIGFPVVMKVHSETITHKSDVGGVKLNIKNEEEVRAAFNEIKSNVARNAKESDFLGCVVLPMITLKDSYEVILGANVDPQFGPVILFGLGGVLVEVFKDKALGLAPLNKTFARSMLEKTKIFQALKGVRGKKPVNIDELVDIIIRFSQLLADHPWISEFDINPMLCSPDGILALDARILVYKKAEHKEEDLPHTCIPVQ